MLLFTSVDERHARMNIKARFVNILLICAHATTEEKDDATKDGIYERLKRSYECCQCHGIKILLGELNAKMVKVPRS